MTELLASDLRQVVEAVWTLTLGFEVQDLADSLPPQQASGWRGSVRIAGAWRGIVKLSLSEALTRRAAAAMFGAPAESLSREDLADALAEITNMTGGNIKALLPGPSRLSLPAVECSAGLSLVPAGSLLLGEVALQSAGSEIRVLVSEGRRPTWLDWDALWGPLAR
jgi:chemotaxis protein CheX